jgi:sigma-B regulation protein RsbU (phosphoserine phosphatase)
MPIYFPEQKVLAGVATFEISLQKIGTMLSKMKIGKRGYAFIVDQSGNYMTHPQKEWVLKRNLYSQPLTEFKNKDNDVQANLREGRRGASIGFSPNLNDEKSWYYFSPLPVPGWNVIIVIPEKELFRDINAIFQSIVIVSVLGILVLFLINFFVFRKMLDPLVRVTHAIQRFTSIPGNEKKSRNEINMLAQSLEDWQNRYGILIKDQSKTATEKLKIEKDLKSAQEIQLNMLPKGNPDFAEYPEIDLFAILKPAEIIGGDLYDYFFIGRNHLLIAIGDVSGKGIPASLFMAIASTLIKTNSKILSSKEIVSRVNKELCERNSNQYFVTLFLGILDVRHGILDYCNAAHNYPYILKADGTLNTLSKSHGLPLGIYSDKTYTNSSVELHFGDTMILYTDGIINSKNIHNQLYGTDKLEMNIENLKDLTAEETVNHLLKSIYIYEGESRQADDISLMALKYLKK